MKRIVLVIIYCCFLLLPALSLAASGLYGSVNAGVSWLADADWSMNGVNIGEAEYDAGYTVGVALGYMRDPFRVEGEIAYQANDMDTFNSLSHPADFNLITYLANGYYDVDTGGAFTPYVTVGLGAATVSFSETGSIDEDDTVFAYQLGVGVGYTMNERLILDFRYRYLATQDPEFSDPPNVFEAETASHNLTVGFRMNF